MLQLIILKELQQIMVVLYGTGGICKLNCFLEIPLTKTTLPE